MMKTSIKRSPGGCGGFFAHRKVGRGSVLPASFPAPSRHAFLLAPFCEQPGPTSARASRQFLHTIETRQSAIPSSRQDCCRVETAMPHYPVDMGFGVLRDDDVAYETGRPRPALRSRFT